MGLAVSLELPLLIIDIQRGGPSTGLPTKTEAADLLHGDVRPPRRVAAADRRRLQPVALLRRRHRGGPHRPQVPHAGDPAVRRLPGQRLRAVAAARRRRRCPTSRSPFATEPNHTDADGNAEFWPYLRDPEHAGPAVGHPRHARPRCTASAASRRRTARGNISYDPDNHERMVAPAGRRRSPASPTTSRRSRSTATTTPSCSCSAGARPGAPSTAPSTAVRRRGHARSPRPTSSTSTRSRRTSARSCAATRKVLVPEMNLGQLVEAAPGRVPRRRPVGHQGPGRAVHRRRARSTPSSTPSED